MNFRLSIFLICLIASSCTIEKRRYTSGYHIEWLSKESGADLASQPQNSAPKDSLHTRTKEYPLCGERPPSDFSDVSNEMEASKDRSNETIIVSTPPGNKNASVLPANKIHGAKNLRLRSLLAQSPISIQTQKPGVDVSGKRIMAYIAFGFALAALILLSIALFFALGWAALGYVALAFLSMLGASLFSMIALVLFIQSDEPLPWYEIFALVVGVIGIVVALRIWVFK